MFEYDSEVCAAAAALDKLDISDELDRCVKRKWVDPYDVRMALEIAFGNEIGEHLDMLGTEEFMQYITERYPFVFDEVVKYKMRGA